MIAPLPERPAARRPGWAALPFLLAHAAGVVGPFLVPLDPVAVAVCVGLYYARMFGITAGYHRYFAHRSYRTGRAMQFLLALLGTLAVQKGVLWWAAHHRAHHKFSDGPADIHSPRDGFFWAHVGWILSPRYDATDWARIDDFRRYPELVWLNRHHLVPPVGLAVLLLVVGGPTLLVWGFFVSTVLLWHGTFAINSLAHLVGRRRFATGDTSRNSLVLAVLTMGEGWHNNHHHYQSTANQGFYWWEIDASFYVLRALAAVGLVWDLRRPPDHVLAEGRERPAADALVASALAWFPEAVRARLGSADVRRALLSKGLRRRLARGGARLEGLPRRLEARLSGPERGLDALPTRIRRVLPSPEELLAAITQRAA